jgi:hypothetical protein
LLGSGNEEVTIEFTTEEKFTSSSSNRTVDIENLLNGYLNEDEGSATTKSIGQAAMILFLVSVGIAVISSFGGNSMEMMWNLMNTLQLMFFLNEIYVTYPTHVRNLLYYSS